MTMCDNIRKYNTLLANSSCVLYLADERKTRKTREQGRGKRKRQKKRGKGKRKEKEARERG